MARMTAQCIRHPTKQCLDGVEEYYHICDKGASDKTLFVADDLLLEATP